MHVQNTMKFGQKGHEIGFLPESIEISLGDGSKIYLQMAIFSFKGSKI